MDLVEIDAASNRGIDAIRELRERINYAPTDLRRKVYILDEAHQITKDAWNALLKSLEEPPDFVVFMFASTHPQDFPPAILSRLQRFDVRRLATDEIEGKLRRILEAEGRAADDSALHLIARLAAGGMRDAESMLDQLLASSADRLVEDRVRDLLGLADADTVEAFVAALATGDVVAGTGILDELEDRGRDLRVFLDQVVEEIRRALVGSTGDGGGLRHGVVELVPVARRLAAVDPNRAGVGGLRLQLELMLFPDAGRHRPEGPPAISAPATDSKRVAAPVAPAGERREPNAARSAEAPRASGVAVNPSATANGAGARARPASPPRVDPGSPLSAPAKVSGDASNAATSAATIAEVPSAAASAAASAPIVELGVGVGGDLTVLRDRWPEVVTRISGHPPTKPLIAVCRPISVEDGVVTLGFPEDQGFLRDVAERRRTVLEEGISAVLGRPVSVRCVATNLDLAPPLPADAEAAFVLAEARRIFGGDDPEAAPID